jgi:hypothetical protein
LFVVLINFLKGKEGPKGPSFLKSCICIDMNNNGKANIYNLEKLNRKIIFRGLEYGHNCYPTDIDMIFNLRNEINIIVDAKEAGKQPVFGQTITYINITDALQSAGIPSYVVWIEHPSDAIDIIAEECLVSRIYHDSKWRVAKKPITYKELQNILLEKHNVEKYDSRKHKFDKKKYMP